MKNKHTRRSFLTTTLKGTALLAAGMSSVSVLQSFANPIPADTDLAFRSKLGMLGSLSLQTSEIALSKASNERVKMFANFEAEEQRAIATVLKELSTPASAQMGRG